MSFPAVQIRISTGEILKRGAYPREDGAPISGLDPDLQWLIVREPFPEPKPDNRLYQVVTTEEVTTEDDAEYPHLKVFRVTYATPKKPTPDIEQALRNTEAAVNSEVLAEDNLNKLLLLGLGALFRRLEGLELGAREQVIADRVVGQATKLFRNDEELQRKIDALAQGQEPDIDDWPERGDAQA